MKKNIVLVGFMGTGKSAVGRLLAERLDYAFLDMDDEIEARAGKPISKIFADEGEAAFRQLEHELALELAGREGLVVAAGGGLVLDPRNMEALSASGLVVCLQANPETILKRVAHDTHRPLLEESDKAERVRSLLAQRQPIYNAIPAQVDTNALSAEEVAERVIRLHGEASQAS